MKKILATAAALTLAATATFADTNYPYPLEKDGVLYNCEATATIVNGKKTRNCIVAGGVGQGAAGDAPQDDDDGAAILGFGGLGTTTTLALIGGVAAAAAIANNNNSSTNGTN
ncbi:hypothetical protein AB2B41_19775 [Marimonas sp. MJW-29]|uniref:Uncharacterized protein n=1 Tax=Sulfitobacter sediminis TaxID=3234186 RepID=A0ABV3RV06_9RHOB